MIHILASRAARALTRASLAAVLVLAVGACNTDELVTVEDPEALRPGDLGGIGAVPSLVAGATRQFVGAYDGFGLDDGYLASSGAVTDEFYWGDTFTTRQAYDQRNFQPASLGNISDPTYERMHQARFNARRAFAVVDEFTTPATAAADAATKAQLRTIEAYVYVTLSEGFCGAVPFSVLADSGPIDPFAIVYGPPIGTNAMNDTAIVRFNEAIALNPVNRLAAVGKGRALLNLGRYAEAAAAVAAVPTTFVFRLEHSQNTSGENNPIASLQSNGRWGVSNLEGGVNASGTALRPDENPPSAAATSAEGIPFRALSDPRVPWQGRPSSNNACFSSAARCWLNNNYPTFDSDVPMASGVEARLIEAEADLQAGNGTAMIDKLNVLRAGAAARLLALYPDQRQVFSTTLAPLVDPVTPEARRDLLFRERALWLFNTGHRQGDLRRLVRNYGLPSNQVFPSGPYFRAGTYGNDVAFPVPFSEENNPNFVRTACVTTQA
jgi:hypothetical protein